MNSSALLPNSCPHIRLNSDLLSIWAWATMRWPHPNQLSPCWGPTSGQPDCESWSRAYNYSALSTPFNLSIMFHYVTMFQSYFRHWPPCLMCVEVRPWSDDSSRVVVRVRESLRAGQRDYVQNHWDYVLCTLCTLSTESVCLSQRKVATVAMTKYDKDFIDQKWVDQRKHGLIVLLRVDVSWLRIKAR